MKFMALLMLMFSFAHAETGVVRKLMGDVFIDGSPAKLNDKIMDGQQLEARGPRSIVIVKFESGSQIVLRDGSLTLEAQGTKKDSVISLVKGVFASHFIRKGKTTQTVKTKHAVMGVRGTKFYVEEKDDSSYLCVCEGKVEISDGSMSAMVGKDEDATAGPGKKIEKMMANKMMIDMARMIVDEMK